MLITGKTINLIRALHCANWSTKRLAKAFGLSPFTIAQICAGIGHMPKAYEMPRPGPNGPLAVDVYMTRH